MPYSGTLLDDKAVEFFNIIKTEVNTVLDVGVGAGKYGKMWYDLVNPQIDMQGVEVCGPYFKRFADVYRKYYSEVHHGDIMESLQSPEVKFDLVIFGDVLEHLPKSSGLDVLHFWVYRCKYMFIQYPSHYIQNPADVDGYFHEAHISVWREADFETLDTPVKFWKEPPLTAVAVKGYIDAAVHI